MPPRDAEGDLKVIYDAATQRAGRVFNILRIQSVNPAVLESSMRLYQAIMIGPSPLTRVEREAMAVVTSRVNDCFY